MRPYPHLTRDMLHFFARMRIETLREDFLIVSLQLRDKIVAEEKLKIVKDSFVMIVLNRDEITLMLPEREWEKIKESFNPKKIEHDYKIIVLEKLTHETIVGHIAIVTKILMDEGIGVKIVSTHAKENLIVKRNELARAVNVLEEFFGYCRRMIGE